MVDMGGKHFWNKHELAEFLDCKVSYVEYKANTRQWPSYLFHEIRFGAQHVEEILALSERPAKKAPQQPSVDTPAPEQRSQLPKAASWPESPPGYAPLRARPERARSYKGPKVRER